MPDTTINALCASVWNIDTRKALKKPKNPANNKIEFRYNELANVINEKAKVNPRYGSVVRARDNNIGICSPHV